MVFGPVRKTAEKLLHLAGQAGVSAEKPVRLDGVVCKVEMTGQAASSTGTVESPGRTASSAGMAVSSDKAASSASGVLVSSSDTMVSSGDPSRGISIRFRNSEALGHLERNFWKYPYSRYAKRTGDICVTASANPYSEVEDAARDILRICRDRGFRFRDIAVTMRNPDDYSSIIKSVFTRYGIPYFLDGKRDIDGHPLIVFILSALEIFASNWSYEAVFRYAKTGLLSIDRHDLDILENYVLANGIRGSMWTRAEDWDYQSIMTFRSPPTGVGAGIGTARKGQCGQEGTHGSAHRVQGKNEGRRKGGHFLHRPVRLALRDRRCKKDRRTLGYVCRCRDARQGE